MTLLYIFGLIILATIVSFAFGFGGSEGWDKYNNLNGLHGKIIKVKEDDK